MNPIRIVVKPSRRWFGGRSQWRWGIVAGNGEPLDPRDTAANVGNIEDVMTKLVNSDIPVVFEVHDRKGALKRTRLR